VSSLSFKTSIFIVLVTALVVFSQIAVVKDSESRSNDFEIVFDKTEVVIPCRCLERRLSPQDEPELQVSVVTSAAVRNQPTFNYRVTAGTIVGNGPVVVWDFEGLLPGTYQISVEVTDSDNELSERISKSVTLYASPECDCNISCPSLEIRTDKKVVKPGDRVTFHLSMLGGEFQHRPIRYNWNVTNGQIESGQGTAEITVLTDKRHKSADVEASATVDGMNPSFNCPAMATESVSFGKQSILNEFPTGPIGLDLDEHELVIACPPETRIRHLISSPDMIVDVEVESGKSLEGSKLLYEVNAGQILGEGNRVRWDLSNTPPGTYKISAEEWVDGKQYGKSVSQTITIVKSVCRDRSVCPFVNINASERMFAPGDTVNVSALLDQMPTSKTIMYNWMTSEGEIISGQSSPVIRVRLPSTIQSTSPRVTLTIGGLDPDYRCPNSVSKDINLRTSP